MKVGNSVLLCAALVAESASAVVRLDIRNHHPPRQFPRSNTSLEASAPDTSTTVLTSTSTSISTSTTQVASSTTTDFIVQEAPPSILDPTTTIPSSSDNKTRETSSPTSSTVLSPSRTEISTPNDNSSNHDTDSTLSSPVSTSDSTLLPSGGSSVPIDASSSIDADRKSSSPTTVSENTQSSVPGPVAQMNAAPLTTASSIDGCQSANPSDCASNAPIMSLPTQTLPNNASDSSTTSSSENCTPLPSNKAVTEFSVVYTSTTTFYGNSSDYTPPFAPLVTPNFCSPSDPALITFFSTSVIPNTAAPITVAAPAITAAKGGSPAAQADALGMPLLGLPSVPDVPAVIVVPDPDGEASPLLITLRPLSVTRHVVTFITTDKNPSVVFSPEPTPGFSQTWDVGDIGDGDHRTLDDIDIPGPSQSTPVPANSVKLPPQPTFQVTAGGDQVVINDQTITGLKPGQTSKVTIGSQTFTILPTAVVGLGSTITKPPPQETNPPAPDPTSKVIGGVSVVISGVHAVIGGSTLSIPSASTTTMINGQRVVLGPGNIAIGTETLAFDSPRPTNEVVSGGQLLTAIGNSVVVLGSATITYGRNIPERDMVINGETISIGPRGVSFHGMTIGGPDADAVDTSYEIVGGITVGKLPHSLVVINGATFTLNTGGRSGDFSTTVIDGQTITIGLNGIIVSSTTLDYPGESVTATLMPSGPYATVLPIETGGLHSGNADDDSAAFLSRPNIHVLLMSICIAIGVLI